MTNATIFCGDCVVGMDAMEAESVDAIITDPPYEIGFMGKRWDKRGVAFDPVTWAACLRVLKPGGRLLAFGAARTAHRIWCAIEDGGFTVEDTIMWLYGSGFPKHASKLKPAYEPIVVARKGAASDLNIDDCRIAFADAADEQESKSKNQHESFGSGARENEIYGADTRARENYNPTGRWPANVIVDEVAAHQLGDVARFFYTAKASRAERNHGLEGMPKRAGGSTAKGFTQDKAAGNDRNAAVPNFHPTVKPVELMRYLVRLVTPPGALVLDPFTGSGTTGVACVLEGRSFVGIELDAAHVAIAERRIATTPLSLFGGDA